MKSSRTRLDKPKNEFIKTSACLNLQLPKGEKSRESRSPQHRNTCQELQVLMYLQRFPRP